MRCAQVKIVKRIVCRGQEVPGWRSGYFIVQVGKGKGLHKESFSVSQVTGDGGLHGARIGFSGTGISYNGETQTTSKRHYDKIRLDYTPQLERNQQQIP